MDTIEIGHQCPHCNKGIVLELDVAISHVTGRIKKPEEKAPLKVEVGETVPSAGPE